jgi:hypothetical protein
VTAKQAVKARCRDCLAGGRECTFTDCALKGLAKSIGKVNTLPLPAYGRWCVNDHPFRVCSSPDCTIYQYRKEQEEAPECGREVSAHTKDTTGPYRTDFWDFPDDAPVPRRGAV